jgi:hypothetical protein
MFVVVVADVAIVGICSGETGSEVQQANGRQKAHGGFAGGRQSHEARLPLAPSCGEGQGRGGSVAR